MTAGAVANEDVVTVSPSASVSEVVGKMDEFDVGMVVVEEENEPVGVVTDRAVAVAVGDSADLPNRSVTELMTEDPVTVHEETHVFQVTKSLEDHAIRRVPVVDDARELVGVISLDDIFVLLGEESMNAVDVLETQSPRF